MANLRYKPSGRISVWGMLKMLFWGIIGSSVLLSAYVYGINWMPNLALRTVVLLIVSFLLSRWMMRLVKNGKMRSPATVFWISSLTVLIGFYVHWAVYSIMVQDVWEYGRKAFWQSHISVETLKKIGMQIINPVDLWKDLQMIRRIGFWSLQGETVNHFALLLCWIGEMLYVILHTASKAIVQARRVFSEERGVWLDQRIEFTIQYIKEHRMLRRQLIKGDLKGLDNIHYYQRKGREAHGTIVFYHRKGIMGPFVSIKMVKAVQTGPRRTRHYFIPIVKQWEIGSDKVEEILTRLVAERGTTHEKVTEKGNWKDRYYWSNKREQLSFAVQQTVEKAKENAGSSSERKYYSGGERVANIEEVTVYAPTITPEMEQEYLAKKAREEQERIWAANREEIRNRRKKSKRRSTRIK